MIQEYIDSKGKKYIPQNTDKDNPCDGCAFSIMDDNCLSVDCVGVIYVKERKRK